MWRTSLWVRLGLGTLLAPLVPVIVTLHPLHTVPKRTPASLGLAFEDVRFRAADGLELAGWVMPHERARGNVIFCHGHGRNRGHVAGHLQTLHDMGLNVLAFDGANDPDVFSGVAASAALAISDIPFTAPTAHARVGRVNGELILFPTVEQLEFSDFDIG